MPLTDTAIRNAKPSSKPTRLFDERGLYLEVSPTGGKWWRLKFRFEGKEKRLFVISFVLVSIPAFSELLRSANPGGLGLRLATGLFVGVCLVQCALVFKKRKQSRASMESSRIP